MRKNDIIYHYAGAVATRLTKSPRRMPLLNRPCLIEASEICLTFGQRQVLQHVSVKVHEGEVVTLIGPNGAGKTTLVRIMLGLLKPQTGRVQRREGLRIGYMPQKLHIEPTLPITVRRFLELALPIFGTTKSTILCILNYSFVGIGFLGSILYFFIASVATFDAIFCSFTKVLNVE